MNYKTFLSENGKYAICEVTGLITRENALEFAEASNQLIHAANVKRLLTDVRNASNALGVLGNYSYAYESMGNLSLRKDVRSAILVDKDDRSHDFLETVALNAGYTVRIFRDEEAAISWLSEDMPL
ncbi:MAG: STAS/SEC14 domain-containing protein [Chloroflexota bacterium]